MNRKKAEHKIRRKLTRVLPCPFCGKIPVFDIRCDYKHSISGSWGHYAIRNKCCPATQGGQTELFFCNNYKKPDYGLWWHMACRMINDWNRRFKQEE